MVGVALEEDEEEDDSETSTSTGKRGYECHSFIPDEEEMLVEFFAHNDCFYNKASPKFGNTAHKRKLLEAMAKKLGTDCEFALPWKFVNNPRVDNLLDV